MLIFFLEKVLRAFYQLFKMIHDHTQKKHKKFMWLCILWPWPLWRRRDGNDSWFCRAVSAICCRYWAVDSHFQALILCRSCVTLPSMSSSLTQWDQHRSKMELQSWSFTILDFRRPWAAEETLENGKENNQKCWTQGRWKSYFVIHEELLCGEGSWV